MSLFKAREFWSTECDIDEKFDQSSLEVSKLNGDYDKVIVGSHGGILRIYQPPTELGENNLPKPYKAADLVVEKLFSEPILQVGTGKLVSGSSHVHIAVLYPLSIAVYFLLIKKGETEHDTQNFLKLKYEHKLKRSSFNFVAGPFGGIQNRDFLCVQSLDGLLTFFEQESFSFCCFLPNFLLPGPLIYVQKTDSFVTVGSNWTVQSFRYKKLSEAGQKSTEDDTIGNKIISDWNYNLGEGVVDLHYMVDTSNESFVVLLGEKNLFCLSCHGILKFMKKLDFSPICFFTYILEQENSLMTLIVSETNTLLVYQNTSVKWSAQLTFLPITIRRAFFENVKGALVLLSEDGKIDCCCLGTEPQLFTAPPLLNQELDFEKVEDELVSLNRIIRNYYASDAKLTNTVSERELTLTIQVEPHLEPCSFDVHSKLKNSNAELQMCSISIILVPQTILEEVQILVHAYKPFKCSKEVEFYNSFNKKATFRTNIYLSELMEITTLNFDVTVSYISSLGVPRVMKKESSVPLKLLMETCPYAKESEHKLTLNINQNPVPLSTIFAEFIGENLTLSSNGIGFKNVHGVGSPVTVLLAKNSQRYRLQSDSFLSLNIVMEQMVVRLKSHFAGTDNFKVTFNSSLPIVTFLSYVRNHFESRKSVNNLNSSLNQLGGQFRIIQKRLIAKFKDKNPTPLSNLEKVLHDTHAEIIQVTADLEIEMDNLERTQNELSCSLQLIKSLLKLMDVNQDVMPTLETTFSSSVYDVDGQNWEDTLDAALCYLLRTYFSKSEKDKIKIAHSSFEEITDVSKLEKHITQVLDRYVKGGPVVESEKEEDTFKEEPSESPPKKEFLPIGSRIGESSVRILSARKGLYRKHRHDVPKNIKYSTE